MEALVVPPPHPLEKDRKAVAAALKSIYTAVNEDAALEALEAFSDSELGRRYPSAVKTFQDAWDRFTPFLAFPPSQVGRTATHIGATSAVPGSRAGRLRGPRRTAERSEFASEVSGKISHQHTCTD